MDYNLLCAHKKNNSAAKETCTRNLYQKLALNRTQLSSVRCTFLVFLSVFGSPLIGLLHVY